MGKQYKSIKIFDNPYLEFFSHIHPVTPLLIFSPVAIYLIWHSVQTYHLTLSQIMTYGFSGLIFWTLVEYLLHRFFFHYESDTAFSKRMHFIVHGFHHVDANDPTRLLMTPAVSIFLSALIFALYRALLGPIIAEPFFAFFLIGYLCYDYTHYYVHFFRPTNPVGRYLKEHHMKHHYVGSQSRWGVSSPLWDIVFGTLNHPAASSREESRNPV